MSKYIPEPYTEEPGFCDGIWVRDLNGATLSRDARHIVACVKNCAGINPKAVPEMFAICMHLWEMLGSEPGHWPTFEGETGKRLENVIALAKSAPD